MVFILISILYLNSIMTTIDEMVSELSKGKIETKLNRYYINHVPIYNIKAAFVNLIKRILFLFF